MTFAHIYPRWTLLCAVLVHLHTAALSLPSQGRSRDARPTPMGSSCDVTGHWRNELGSRMQLSAKDSSLQGFYKTAVETTAGAAGNGSTLTGFVSGGVHPTVSFSVLWKGGSCTSWVGQCFILPTGDRVLKTVWMLRSVAKGPGDNWMSTRVGADTFSFVGAC
ncbi:avidin-like isoform X2 [Engraulis encrasicolus]|uniref:avidin-like n=1 Tax=Engraulis encrasicolus TaxID=184585 RepID=UPI002FD41755